MKTDNIIIANLENKSIEEHEDNCRLECAIKEHTKKQVNNILKNIDTRFLDMRCVMVNPCERDQRKACTIEIVNEENLMLLKDQAY